MSNAQACFDTLCKHISSSENIVLYCGNFPYVSLVQYKFNLMRFF